MPRICFTVIYLLLTAAGLSGAEIIPPTDGAVLDSLFSDAVRIELKAFPSESENPDRSARLDVPVGLRPAAEAAVSGAGFSLAGAEGESDCRIAVSISDIRRTIIRRGHGYDRRLALTLHLTGADRNGTVLLARRIEREYSDRLSRKHLEPTNSAEAFNGLPSRRVTIGAPGKLRIATFAVLSTALGVFAFRK